MIDPAEMKRLMHFWEGPIRSRPRLRGNPGEHRGGDRRPACHAEKVWERENSARMLNRVRGAPVPQDAPRCVLQRRPADLYVGAPTDPRALS